MPTGGPLTPAQIPPFQLPDLGQRRPGGCSRGLRPSAQGPGLLHVPVLTTALGLQVFAERPRILCQEAPLWETLPRGPADERQTGHGLTPDRQDTPEMPPPGSFEKLRKLGQILWDSGTYTCVASNAGGNDTYFATLTVQLAANRTQGDGHNETQVGVRFPLDLTTILVSTAMGCITFLGVVLFCFLLLFVWSRGRGQHKNNFSVEYSFRKVDGPAAAAGQGGARKFNMKMI
ncbi:leucine-rich repeat and immunoglobulin-like domain-containing nogo receptor-interacting protein 3 [Cricetulus griseus]|nr:leucine-rich repeat and immunoglobulin-like domain-containing nogo receptor-interacting protein 3 [Cricetulus griseus]